MKVEYVTPFVSAAISVMEVLLGKSPERGNLSARPQLFTTMQVNVVCGITGPIEGQVIYGMSAATAEKIASTMLGQAVVTFDALAASAIAELGNMVCGHAVQGLSQTGFTCDITPPTIIRGTNIRVSTYETPTLVVPLTIPDAGSFEINISLKERVRIIAA